MEIRIPDNAKKIIDILYEHGYEAYVVGGCVRDSLLGKTPKDWDITTSAAPYEVKSLFSRTIDTGIEHGTVTVMFGKEGYEVTTYRIDGEYKDSRRPESVEFTNNLTEDLRRRDFTINAMAYNDKVGVVDEFNGIDDLKNRVIRCVGDPVERFTEDALRILRAVRFSAQLDFEIESDTKVAIESLALSLDNISAERIKVELDKILLSDNPEKIHDAYELGITNVVLPEYDAMVDVKQETKHHMYSVDKHTIESIKYMSKELRKPSCKNIKGEYYSDKEQLMLMWTMLLHDIAKPICKYYDDEGIAHFKTHEIKGVDMAREVFNRLKFDNYTSKLALKLIRWHDYRFTNDLKSMRRAMNKIGEDIFDYLFLVKEADVSAQHVDTIVYKLKDIGQSYKLYSEIIENNQCVSLKDLAVTGKDLIQLGVKPGPTLGAYLKELLEMVIDDPELNTKENLLNRVKEML